MQINSLLIDLILVKFPACLEIIPLLRKKTDFPGACYATVYF